MDWIIGLTFVCLLLVIVAWVVYGVMRASRRQEFKDEILNALGGFADESVVRASTKEPGKPEEPEEEGDWLPPGILAIEEQSAIVLHKGEPRPVYTTYRVKDECYHRFWKFADTNEFLSVYAPMIDGRLQQALAVKFKPSMAQSRALRMLKDHT